MCGLVGIYTPQGVTLKQKEVFNNLLYADALRGHHSTGVFSLSFTGKQSVHKEAGTAIDLIETKAYEQFMRSTGKVFFGHNRYATMGAHTAENAHPFHHGDVVLAHNGTLWEHSSLTADYFQIDSEAICKAISEAPVNGVKGVLEKLDGAYALQWHDKRDNSLNFARNDERPLAIAVVTDATGDFVAWASESLMLEWCLQRKGFKEYEINELPVERFMKLKISNKLGKPQFTEFKALDQTFGYGSGNWGGAWGNAYAGYQDSYQGIYGGNNSAQKALDNKYPKKNNSLSHKMRLLGLYENDLVPVVPVEILDKKGGESVVSCRSDLYSEVCFDMETVKFVSRQLTKEKIYVKVIRPTSDKPVTLGSGKSKEVKELTVLVGDKIYTEEEYEDFLDNLSYSGLSTDEASMDDVSMDDVPFSVDEVDHYDTVAMANGEPILESTWNKGKSYGCAVCSMTLNSPETSLRKGDELIHDDCEHVYNTIMEGIEVEA
jgi:hypothetical protein